MTQPADSDRWASAVRAALREVRDPEVGESIVDLGLLERIEIGEAQVRVTLVPTSATCPMSEVLLEDVEAAVRRVCPAPWDVSVQLDWERPWDPERMSPELRSRFGWDEPAD